MGRSTHGRVSDPGYRALPEGWFKRLHDQLGQEVTGLAEALNEAAPVSIRINPAKWAGRPGKAVPWCTTGHYLEERPAFTFDPLLHAGCYYVQEASSMLLDQAVRATGLLDQRILALDLCAAPGGKSTLLRSLLRPGSVLVSNEVDPHRQLILQENSWKWGMPGTVITNSPAADLDRVPSSFDLVVVDAPCSGEGMFRKDPFARTQWNERLVDRCARDQAMIVRHAWNALKPGGFLLYSTCTWELTENEANMVPLMALGGTSIPVEVDADWGMQATQHLGVHAVRCYPHRMDGEGFVLAVVRKPGEWEANVVLDKPSAAPTPIAELSGWLNAPETWRSLEREDTVQALASATTPNVERVLAALRVRCAGIPLAERKGDGWRPHPGLALSTALDRSRFPTVELGHDEAIDHLRGLTLSAEAASGAALATYRGCGLGWFHGAGNRWNNRWPAAWRIRTQHPKAPSVSWAGHAPLDE